MDDANKATRNALIRFGRSAPFSRPASTAARIGSTLPTDILRSLLRHPDPGIRASACGCARRCPELISVMIDLLDDLNQGVARSAACALGQIGRIEARPMLAKLLRDDQTTASRRSSSRRRSRRGKVGRLSGQNGRAYAVPSHRSLFAVTSEA